MSIPRRSYACFSPDFDPIVNKICEDLLLPSLMCNLVNANNFFGRGVSRIGEIVVSYEVVGWKFLVMRIHL